MPLALDGSKAPQPDMKWRCYRWEELEPYFLGRFPSGIGLLCGERSLGLQVLDFDDPSIYPLWAERIPTELLDRLPLVATPSNGRHLYYRSLHNDHNTILAQDEQKHILIETRGQGGMVVSVGSPLLVHWTDGRPTGRPYTLLHGDLLDVPYLTTDEKATLWSVARSFNRYIAPKKRTNKPKQTFRSSNKPNGKPSDKLNLMVWEDILEPKDWTIDHVSGSVIYWRKPNSTKGNHHATTGYGQTDVFYCFSTDAPPFESEQSYNRFACYTLLYHNGDFRKSADALRRQT